MEGHDIGTMRYIDLPEDVLHTICARHLNLVNKKLHDERPPATNVEADHAWCWKVRVNSFLVYPRGSHSEKHQELSADTMARRHAHLRSALPSYHRVPLHV